MIAVDDRPAGMAPPLAVHVDLDGASTIFRAHGRTFNGPGEPIYSSGMRNMLALFEAMGVRATLFTIADDLRDGERRRLIEEARDAGHEIASHSVTHPNLRTLDRESKRREIADSRALLQDALGVDVRGFRAPGYSIDREGLECLSEAGYAWDSSAFATAAFARRLGVADDVLTRPLKLPGFGGLIEIPLPDHRPLPVPIGASYAILGGLAMFRWGMARAAKRGVPSVLLFHLIDFAAPLMHDQRGDLRMSIFTLSVRSEAAKTALCQRMLSFVAEHFTLTTTSGLLGSLDSSVVGT
jgi:peptidoglycan/xylan/chitin deacetylase (PgdA/CDA1 family)